MPELAIEFFSKFARLEYALKSVDNYRVEYENGDVAADWNEFANREKIAILFKQAENDSIARYLIEKPPKKRAIKAGLLDWGNPVARPRNMDSLWLAMRQVGNNLFHGDKGHVGSERDTNLLNACIRIMDVMLEADLDVSHYYEFEW